MSNLRERAEEAFKIEKERAQELMILQQIETDKKFSVKLKKEMETVFGEKVSPTKNEVVIDGITFSMWLDSTLQASIQCPKCNKSAARPVANLIHVGELLAHPEKYCSHEVEFVPSDMMRGMTYPESSETLSAQTAIEEKPKTLWQKIVGGK
jgi:hypothetical protein